jgi:hypothetical protein
MQQQNVINDIFNFSFQLHLTFPIYMGAKIFRFFFFVSVLPPLFKPLRFIHPYNHHDGPLILFIGGTPIPLR